MSLSSISTLLQRATVCGLIGATGFGFVTVGRQVNYIRLQTQAENRRLEALASSPKTDNPEKVSFKSPSIAS
ncbi:hypothetical protein TrVE_jg8141 [Triparma verrucosa]|uniref:Uncharacterized protein n=1 Tax=Triparma verrucosa TaxID=1606542 RepID=A0A9W7BZL9_9STRA|nr:hypothetical protein TrVE_jg8141 [Triparma verrucosa]